MTRTILILIIFIAIAANAQEKLGINVRGAPGKVQIMTGSMFSAADQEAMQNAQNQVFGDEIPEDSARTFAVTKIPVTTW